MISNELRDVRPCLAGDDFTDGYLRNAVVGSDVYLSLSGCISSTDRTHGIGVEPGIAVPFPDGTPALGGHVCQVIDLGPQEQVIRINARRVIAGVQHLRLGGDRAVVQFPGRAMSENPMPTLAGCNFTVAALLLRGGPFPASRGDSHLRPKALDDGHCAAIVPYSSNEEVTR